VQAQDLAEKETQVTGTWREASTSTAWQELPAAVREAIEQHTGPVTEATAGGEGMSTTARLILRTAQGQVFIKGTGPDSADYQRERIDLGAAMAPYVTAISPPLLWQVRVSGWNITGWPALPGRPWADQHPGSPDIPKIAAILGTLATIPAPDALTRTAHHYWGNWADDPRPLDGHALVHGDPNPTNFVIDGNRAWLVDWGWACRGPAWLTAALLVLSMTEAGWDAADAEQALADMPAWTDAPRHAVSAFADANSRMWDDAVNRASTKARRFRRDVARAWASHRATLT
jgi:hypothetical protein